MNERIETLEVELAYTRRMVDELNDVIATQGDRIAVFEGQLQTLARVVRSLRDGGEVPEGSPDEEPPPPHY